MARSSAAGAAGVGENGDKTEDGQGLGSRVRRVPSEFNLGSASPLPRPGAGAGGENGSGGAQGRAGVGGGGSSGASAAGKQQAADAPPPNRLGSAGEKRGVVDGETEEVQVVRAHERSELVARSAGDCFERRTSDALAIGWAGAVGGREVNPAVRLWLMLVALVVRALMQACLRIARLSASLLDRLEGPAPQAPPPDESRTS